MSSSRSIAAARQKRAGEQSSNTNNNSGRPVTSISSSSVFSQQPQQPQQSRQPPGNIKYNQINTNAGRQQRSGNSQTQQSISTAAQQKQLTKISVPDAIGLITLRLGKLEKFIQESMEDGSLSFMSNNSNNNSNDFETNNMKLVSDEVFENITNRLENLEKKNNSTNNNTGEQITKINKDIKDIKDSINNLNMKVSSFINETQEKFLDYESAIVEIEKNIGITNEELDNVEEENNNNLMMENIDGDTEIIVSETIDDSISTSGFDIKIDYNIDEEE
jgi:hypothetical protein